MLCRLSLPSTLTRYVGVAHPLCVISVTFPSFVSYHFLGASRTVAAIFSMFDKSVNGFASYHAGIFPTIGFFFVPRLYHCDFSGNAGFLVLYFSVISLESILRSLAVLVMLIPLDLSRGDTGTPRFRLGLVPAFLGFRL